MWVTKQRGLFNNGTLKADQRDRLIGIGFQFSNQDDGWEDRFSELQLFKEEHGHCNVPSDWDANLQLGVWVNNQRSVFKSGTLQTDRRDRLVGIGFQWILMLKSEGLHCDVCNKSFSSYQGVAMNSVDKCNHLSCWQIPTEVKADLLKQENSGDASVIAKCLRIYADTNPSYSWIQTLHENNMSRLVKHVRGQLFLNPGVYKPHHMLEHASSPKLLMYMAQSPDLTTPFIAHNAENTASSTQQVPEVATATDSAESLVFTLQDCDLDSMTESELRSLVSEHKSTIYSSFNINIDIDSFLASNDSELHEWQYIVWWNCLSLNIAQMNQIRILAVQLWIILNGSKIGYSRSLILLLLKLLLLQSYVPFAIIHFQAIQCKSGFDREQCCHFKFHKNRIAGEFYLLTSDDVSGILKPFMGDSDGRVISGRMRLPRLQNRTMPDTMDGQIYAGKRRLPDEISTTLLKISPHFYKLLLWTVKTGSKTLTTTNQRLSHYIWGNPISLEYSMVNSANPIVNEKKIQFEYVEKELHHAGEYALLNKELYGDLEKRMISMSTDGRLIRGTYLRTGKREHYETGDITRWVLGGSIDSDEAFATMNHPNISLVETEFMNDTPFRGGERSLDVWSLYLQKLRQIFVPSHVKPAQLDAPTVDPVPSHAEPAPLDAPTVEHVPTDHKRSAVRISSESSGCEDDSFSNDQPTKKRLAVNHPRLPSLPSLPSPSSIPSIPSNDDSYINTFLHYNYNLWYYNNHDYSYLNMAGNDWTDKTVFDKLDVLI